MPGYLPCCFASNGKKGVKKAGCMSRLSDGSLSHFVLRGSAADMLKICSWKSSFGGATLFKCSEPPFRNTHLPAESQVRRVFKQKEWTQRASEKIKIRQGQSWGCCAGGLQAWHGYRGGYDGRLKQWLAASWHFLTAEARQTSCLIAYWSWMNTPARGDPLTVAKGR